MSVEADASIRAWVAWAHSGRRARACGHQLDERTAREGRVCRRGRYPCGASRMSIGRLIAARETLKAEADTAWSAIQDMEPGAGEGRAGTALCRAGARDGHAAWAATFSRIIRLRCRRSAIPTGSRVWKAWLLAQERRAIRSSLRPVLRSTVSERNCRGFWRRWKHGLRRRAAASKKSRPASPHPIAARRNSRRHVQRTPRSALTGLGLNAICRSARVMFLQDCTWIVIFWRIWRVRIFSTRGRAAALPTSPRSTS